jgi:hypothetical protein
VLQCLETSYGEENAGRRISRGRFALLSNQKRHRSRLNEANLFGRLWRSRIVRSRHVPLLLLEDEKREIESRLVCIVSYRFLMCITSNRTFHGPKLV